MTDEDPCPLKAGGEASPELVHALYAIRRHDPDPARLARVAERLGAAIAGGPPPGAAAAGKWLGAKTWITSLVLGVSAFLLLGVPRAEEAAAPAPVAPPSSSPVPVPEPVQNHAPIPQVAPTPTPQAAPARTSPRRASRSRASTPAAIDTTTVDPTPTDTLEPAAPTSVRELLENPKPPAPPKKPTAAAPRSEVELLFEARVAMPRQPAAALRLLDEHASRFPGGQLGPEREVLAIEALRKLGRTAEASRRLTEFHARYPRSIHQRRLRGSDGQPKI